MSEESRPTICRFCFNACGVVVDFADGAPVRVRGDADDPVYQGFICIKGQQLLEARDHPDRLLHSMKRDADGAHRPIASQSAFDEIAERIAEIRERYGARAIATYAGTFSVANPATGAVATAWMKGLRSRMMFNSNTIDQPGKAVAQALHGAWMAPCHDFASARVALLVGANPLVAMSGGLPQGNPGRFLTDALERGLHLIVIDPRRTELASRAQIHIQPRPGYDAEILAAMLRVIFDARLQDAAFLEEHVTGLEALQRAVRPYLPERVGLRAGVSPEQIVDAARCFAEAGRGVASAGTGPNMSGHGTLMEYLLLCLNTVCGRWLRAGEHMANPGTLVPQFPAKAQAFGPYRAYGFGEPLRVRGLANTAAGMPTAALADEILMEGDGRVRALISIGGNPVAAWPDQLKTIEAMKKLDLLVQIDIKMSATAKLADYLIATKVPLEMPGLTLMQDFLSMYSQGFGYPVAYGRYTPALLDTPEGSDLVEDWELFYETAKRLELELRVKPVSLTGPGQGDPVVLDFTRKPTTDDLCEMLTNGSRIALADVKARPHGGVFPEPAVTVEAKDPGWEGRLDVGNSDMLRELGELAQSHQQATTVDANDGAESGFPYRLISRRLMTAYNSSGRDLPRLRTKWAYNPAFMNPADLARLGLQSGDLVEIRSDHAAIFGIVEPDETVREGLVSMSHSFGDVPEHDGEVASIGSNTGRLTPVDRDYDRYTGLPRMSNIPVRVTACTAAADRP
jgi:anaerobic selenocysteine-containing dehydrogenase